MTIEVSLIERKKKGHLYYTLRWSDSRGQTRQKSLGRARSGGPDGITWNAARRSRRQHESALNDGKELRDKPRELTLTAYTDELRAAMRGERATATLETRRSVVAKFVESMGTDKALSKIDRADVKRFLAACADVSVYTKRSYMRTLRSILRRAVQDELIARDPTETSKAGIYDCGVRKMHYFTEGETDALVDCAPSLAWQATIRLSETAGLRKGEIEHLLWSNIDLERGTITVEARAGAEYTLPSGEVVAILPWRPKCESSERTIPHLPPHTIAILQRLKLQSQGCPYIVLDLPRLRRLTRRYKAGKLREDAGLVVHFTKVFNEIQSIAGARFGGNWRRGVFHDLRKSFATRAAAGNVRVPELKSHLGHASSTTTLKHYAGVIDAAAKSNLAHVFDRREQAAG